MLKEQSRKPQSLQVETEAENNRDIYKASSPDGLCSRVYGADSSFRHFSRRLHASPSSGFVFAKTVIVLVPAVQFPAPAAPGERTLDHVLILCWISVWRY